MFNSIYQTFSDTRHNIYIKNHFDYYLKKRISSINAANLRFTLPKDLEKDYISYYKSYGFKYVSLNQIRLIYSLTGSYDRNIIPDEIFNMYIDPVFPNIRDFWQNKAYQKSIVPDVNYPNTIVRNVNGYFIDNEDRIISEDDALSLIHSCDRVVIKPSVFTGGGYKVKFFQGCEIDKAVFSLYGRDFIVQERLRQSRLMAGFNESAVNTEKIISLLWEGQVYILSAFLRIAAEGAEVDNVTDNDGGLRVMIKPDGSLNDFAYDGALNKVYSTKSGIRFSEITLPQHSKCLELIKKAHTRLLYFPVVSWDFAQREDGEPVLIEYNLKFHEPFDYQIQTGPLFGELSEEVLKKAAQAARQSKSLLYR